jgi:uncharacterized protein
MSDTASHGIETTADGVSIKVYAAPRSSSNKVVGVHNGEIKVALAAPPVEGAANRALVEFLAKALGVPKGNVSLVSGEGSRHKVVRVTGVRVEAVVEKLLPGSRLEG